MPRGWKVCGRLILCQECQRQRYRRKSLTMPVRDSIGARWPVFEAALEEAWTQATPLLISGAEWELTILGNQPLIRVSIGTRRWLLTLHCAKWSRGRKIAAERIASGQAVAKELFFRRRPSRGECGINGSHSDQSLPYQIVCRMVAWFPRTRSALQRAAEGC